MRAGIATHFCPADKVEELKAALLALPANAQPSHISALLDTCHEPRSEFSLTPHLKDIAECFTASSLDEIIAKLKKVRNIFNEIFYNLIIFIIINFNFFFNFNFL